MSVAYPEPKKWTVEECYRLQESGLLEGRYEVIHGEIYSKMGQKPPHSRSLSGLLLCLDSIFSMRRIRIQSPIALPAPHGRYSEPEPDVVVTVDNVLTYTEHPTPADLLLAAEVSDTSLRFDRRTKAPLYAQCGVEEYWILDVVKRQLFVYREPSEDGYRYTRIYAEGETVALLAKPEAPIAVKDLFPPAE